MVAEMDRGKWAIVVVELDYARRRLEDACAMAQDAYVLRCSGAQMNSRIALDHIASILSDAIRHLRGLADVVDFQIDPKAAGAKGE